MIDLTKLDEYRNRVLEHRIAAFNGSFIDPDDLPYGGMFILPSAVDRRELRIIASRWRGNALDQTDPPWNHASVSRVDRCPTWEEMEQVKRLFWTPDAVCMQLHVAETNHISVHPYCLHIWQPCMAAIPLPPPNMMA